MHQLYNSDRMLEFVCKMTPSEDWKIAMEMMKE